MEGFAGTLGDRAVLDVVAYIKTFSKRFGDEAAEPELVDLPRQAHPATAAAVRRGRNLFLLLKCWDCHGIDGQGNGPSVHKLKDAAGRPVSPRDFTAGVFKGGRGPEDIYRTLATGLDGTPMVPVFDAPRIMLAPLVYQREQYQKNLPELEKQLAPDDVASLRKYVSTLPSADELDMFRDDQKAWLLERWRWDLVSYVRSRSESGASWRSILGE